MFCVRVSSGSYHVVIKVDMPLESSCNGLFISHNKKLDENLRTSKVDSRLTLGYFPPMFLISRCAKQATIANHIFTSPALQSRRWFLSNIFSRNPLMAAARVRWLQKSLSLLSFFFFLILFYFKKRASWGDSSFVPSGRLANSIGFSYNTIISCFIFVVCVQG